MNHPLPEPLFGDARSAAPERKAAPASVLAAPRLPVTRWNRKVLLAGAAVLASIVGLGFYLGFGGANSHPKKHDDLQAAAETDNPQQPEIGRIGRSAAQKFGGLVGPAASDQQFRRMDGDAIIAGGQRRGTQRQRNGRLAIALRVAGVGKFA